jgi:mRNA (guanine-N7-)-methyltransferase
MDSLVIRMQSVSINNLLKCIESLNLKNEFENSVGPKVMDKINKESRNESKVISLRKFHNWVKSELISRITKMNILNNMNNKNNKNLLDIAVGRGGDLFKWQAAGITNVTGIDINSDSINSKDPQNPGAIMRYSQSKVKNIKVTYLVGDVTDSNLKIKGKYSFVSCQFALHYFFQSEESLRNVLRLVSSALVPGGYFYGTTVDGEKIKSLKNLEGEYYSIKKEYSGTKGVFGKGYSFLIKDTAYSFPMKEYLVNFDTLNKIAREYSLEPEYTEIFEDYYLGSTNITPFGVLLEKYQGPALSEEEKLISGLNSIFIFKKK